MKKLLLLLLVFAGFMACENEIIEELPQEVSKTEGISAKENQKIDVCHKGKIINVSVNALGGHQGHGDAVDMDGDGYFDIANDCSERDCDDNNAEVNPGVIEICGNDLDDNCNLEIDEGCLAIGNIHEGGIIFYLAGPNEDLNGDGEPDQGLVATSFDIDSPSSTLPWGCYGFDLLNVPNVEWNGGNPSGLGAEIGDGMDNTNNILLDCPTSAAALAARSFGPEWFLPSIKELNEMYLNKTIIETHTGPLSLNYWSSTEYNLFIAWAQFFGDGNLLDHPKFQTYSVRAVRAF